MSDPECADNPSHEDEWLRALKELDSAGKDVFAGVDPDDYVARLRDDWD